jgi:hypothetical protein
MKKARILRILEGQRHREGFRIERGMGWSIVLKMVKVKEEYLRRRKSCYIFKNNVHSEKKVMVTKKKIKFFF